MMTATITEMLQNELIILKQIQQLCFSGYSNNIQ